MSTPWLLTPARRTMRPPFRLFCVPHSGAGASTFGAWMRRFGDEVEVCAVQLPGRENRLREPPCRDWATLIQELGAALSPRLDVPFALFGHSMGALVAFELARHFRRSGGPTPARLLVSAFSAPQLRKVRPPLLQLDDEEFLRDVTARYNGMPAALMSDPESRALYLPILRADLRLLARYQFEPGPPLSCPISAFAGRHDTEAPATEVDAWRGLTTGEFVLREYDGDHFYLVSCRDRLIADIATDLDAARGGR
jgi:medium-chain acyl-[acyl-carrier-protein] hydrolase